jgi:hypothetical protein
MKKIIWPLLVGVLLVSCSNNNDRPLPNATVTVVDEGAKDAGLDLQALGELVKKSPSPAKLEEALNKPGSINNLDLDKDGKVDYIKVNEEAGKDGKKDLKFVDESADGTKTEVADVSIDKGSDNQGNMNVAGNQTIYGNNNSYHSSFPIGEVLLMAYLFAPHPMYYSPFGFGAYPGYYRPYAPVPMASYRTTVNTYTSHPTGTLAKPAPSRSLSGSTHSQKSFGVRSSSKPVGSGGFGSHSSSSSSGSSSSYHSSGRSFGRSRRH